MFKQFYKNAPRTNVVLAVHDEHPDEIACYVAGTITGSDATLRTLDLMSITDIFDIEEVCTAGIGSINTADIADLAICLGIQDSQVVTGIAVTPVLNAEFISDSIVSFMSHIREFVSEHDDNQPINGIYSTLCVSHNAASLYGLRTASSLMKLDGSKLEITSQPKYGGTFKVSFVLNETRRATVFSSAACYAEQSVYLHAFVMYASMQKAIGDVLRSIDSQVSEQELYKKLQEFIRAYDAAIHRYDIVFNNMKSEK